MDWGVNHSGTTCSPTSSSSPARVSFHPQTNVNGSEKFPPPSPTNTATSRCETVWRIRDEIRSYVSTMLVCTYARPRISEQAWKGVQRERSQMPRWCRHPLRWGSNSLIRRWLRGQPPGFDVGIPAIGSLPQCILTNILAYQNRYLKFSLSPYI